MGWCLEIWGDYACFTRPEMKVERVSYDVITPSAARGIFEAILWKPAIRWHITQIEVLNPIRWISVRRNEVGRVFSGPSQAQLAGASGDPMGFAVEDHRQQRAGLFLRDVRYRVHAWFEFLNPAVPHKAQPGSPGPAAETEAKYAAMFERRARKGQCFHRPYLGTREFACDFRLVDPGVTEPPAIGRSEDLGWMLYDIDFNESDNPTPLFFRARIENGVVDTDRRRVEVRG